MRTTSRPNPPAAVAGQIKLAGAKLEEVVGPAAKGPLGASVSFSGRATSPEALLTVMAGKGEIELGAAPSTIAKWRRGPNHGGTRYPQHHTLEAVLRANGKRFAIIDDSADD